MPYDPRIFRPVHGEHALQSDLICAACGYNLRGLRSTGRCPECGGAIAAGGAAAPVRGLLALAPSVRSRMALGFRLAMFAVIVALAARVAYLFSALVGFNSASETYAIVLLANSVLWAIAVPMLLPPTSASASSGIRHLERAIRTGTMLFLLGSASLLVARFRWFSIVPEALVEGSQMLLRLLGAVSVALLAWRLSQVAEDEELDDTARRARAVAVLGLLPTLMIQVFPAQMEWYALVPLSFLLFWWGWLLIWLALVLRDLGGHLSWAGRIQRSQVHRQQRVDELRDELTREANERVRDLPHPKDDDLPLSRRDANRSRRD